MCYKLLNLNGDTNGIPLCARTGENNVLSSFMSDNDVVDLREGYRVDVVALITGGMGSFLGCVLGPLLTFDNAYMAVRRGQMLHSQTSPMRLDIY